MKKYDAVSLGFSSNLAGLDNAYWSRRIVPSTGVHSGANVTEESILDVTKVVQESHDVQAVVTGLHQAHRQRRVLVHEWYGQGFALVSHHFLPYCVP